MPTLEEIFAEMPNRLNAEQAQGVDMTIQFNLSGDEGGDYVLHVADGEANVVEESMDDATATIKMDATDYKQMVTGQLDPMTAFMTGKVKVEGDLGAVMKMQSLFDL